MKLLLMQIRAAVLLPFVLAVVCCGVYPVVVLGFSQAFFPRKANGSLIVDAQGNILGSRLIGQQFASDRYFHSRPSAAGNGYDSACSGGGNLGPTSRKLRDFIAHNASDYRAQNGLATDVPVPSDAVTASASGLDPHISPSNAEFQVSRVAKARGSSEEKIRLLIGQHTDRANLGILGDPGVNVLELNLALDAIGSSAAFNAVTHVQR
jgi:potassium-transporting ATPase KdpC subunit